MFIFYAKSLSYKKMFSFPISYALYRLFFLFMCNDFHEEKIASLAIVS